MFRSSGFTLVVLVAALVSFATSAAGFYVWFSASMPTLFALSAAVLASGFLQLCIVLAWRAAFEHRGGRTLAFIVALSCAAISAGFASGSYLMGTSRDRLLEVAIDQENTTHADAMTAYSMAMGTLGRNTAMLARLADARALRETTHSDTCQKKPLPQKVCGPRCRMRKAQAKMGREISEKANALRGEAGGIADRWRSIRDPMMRTALAKEARHLARDPRLSSIETDLSWMREGYATGFTDLRTGKKFVCDDPAFVIRLDELQADLARLPPPPVAAPPRTKYGYGDAVRHGYAVVLGGMSALLGSGSMPPGSGLALFGLIPAGVMELLIVAFSRMAAAREQEAGTALTPLDRFLIARKPLPERLRTRHADHARFLLAFRIRTPDEILFLSPCDGDPDVAGRAQDTAVLLGLRERSGPLPVHRIDPDLTASLARASGGARHYRAWSIPEPLDDWTRAALRDAPEAIRTVEIIAPEHLRAA